MGDHVIVTGGAESYGTDKVVSVYDEGGWVEDWPQLNTGRSAHGCGHYVNSYSKEVTYTNTVPPVEPQDFCSKWGKSCPRLCELRKILALNQLATLSRTYPICYTSPWVLRLDRQNCTCMHNTIL